MNTVQHIQELVAALQKAEKALRKFPYLYPVEQHATICAVEIALEHHKVFQLRKTNEPAGCSEEAP